MVRKSPELRSDPRTWPVAASAHMFIFAQEEMAAASLDVNFKEELSAIEQCALSVMPLPPPLTISRRVQGPLRSRAHSRSLQSFATLYSSPDSLLHHSFATNGEI